jgi:hypothetical protein
MDRMSLFCNTITYRLQGLQEASVEFEIAEAEGPQAANVTKAA